uniref:Uncharacterized protein n=1 Tax=Varanus komodoensis TaxID=61221 RepID=A0A8D2LII4_VARKO
MPSSLSLSSQGSAFKRWMIYVALILWTQGTASEGAPPLLKWTERLFGGFQEQKDRQITQKLTWPLL